MLFDLTKYDTPSASDNAPRFQPLAQPLPENTVVRVRLYTVQSEYCPADCRDGCITEAKTGLRSLRVALVITDGPYAGQGWYDSIVLPVEAQRIQVGDKQQKACKLGGRTLVRFLASAGKPRTGNSWHDFDGLEACVTVGVHTYAGNSRQVLKEVLTPTDQRAMQAPAPAPVQVQPMQAQPVPNWGQPAPAAWPQQAPAGWGQQAPAPRTAADDEIPF